MKKGLILGIVACALLNAATLKDAVNETLNTNPTIKKNLFKFLETKEGLKIAKSGNLPVVNFQLNGGIYKSHVLRDQTPDVTYRYYKTALILTQNLFNGYATVNKINFQKAKIMQSAYNYLNAVNKTSFEAVNAYINVLKTKKLLENQKQYLNIVENTVAKVNKLYKGGMTTKSEVTKITAIYYAAKSNLLALKDKYVKAVNEYIKIIGDNPDNLSNVNDISIPQTLNEAIIIADKNNPAINAVKFAVKMSEAKLNIAKSSNYPKIDLNLRQNYNVVSKNNPWDTNDDRFNAELALTYNIFRGYADKSRQMQAKLAINEQLNNLEEVKRKINTALKNNWDLMKTLKERMSQIEKYKEYANKTLKLYQKEFMMGRRTLLELLTVQNDLLNAKNQYAEAKYNYTASKYAISMLTGTLIDNLFGKNNVKINLGFNE